MSFVSRLIDRRNGAEGAGSGAGGAGGAASSPIEAAIEPMRRRHLRSVLTIEAKVYPKPWTLGVFHTELEGARLGERQYVVARFDGEVVGYGGLMFVGDEAHVTNIAVDPACHRRGIGTTLLVTLARIAIDRGCRHLSLEVRVSNTAAQELYRRFGFAPAGVRKNYYENVEDAIVMWCHDIDTAAYLDRLRALEGDR
ncbi:MAG: ribosomal protein S18-alanine N-acetyltransferase [Acidimicrobiia bacterium]